MLTRIEISGFKTFDDFSLDLNPFQVILGPNASGKSNLFDAIQLLSRFASHDIRTAMKGLRGEPRELFRRDQQGSYADAIRFAVEVLLDRRVRDPWGQEHGLSHTRLRYELRIEWRRDDRGIERPLVVHESADPILRKDDRWLQGRRMSPGFSESYLVYTRKSAFLSTSTEQERQVFLIGQDRRAGRKRPVVAAEATVLSSMTTSDFPHLYALGQELRSWRFLQLDPIVLRRPSPVAAPEELEPDGSNLAAVLARIQAETATTSRPRGLLPDIASDLADLIPGVLDVSVDRQGQPAEYRVQIAVGSEPPFSSRVVSDGTLRLLALLTLLHDPRHRGLLCFEEPENGIHPARLALLIRRLRETVTDPSIGPEAAHEPLSQIIVNSHSPVVLSALRDVGLGDILFAEMAAVSGNGTTGGERRTRMRPVRSDDQGRLPSGEDRSCVTSFEVQRYLHYVSASG